MKEDTVTILIIVGSCIAVSLVVLCCCLMITYRPFRRWLIRKNGFFIMGEESKAESSEDEESIVSTLTSTSESIEVINLTPPVCYDESTVMIGMQIYTYEECYHNPSSSSSDEWDTVDLEFV